MMTSFVERRPLWEPSEAVKQQANVTRYMQWLAREKGLTFQTYEELWEWSVTFTSRFFIRRPPESNEH
jgi:acetoacetyl-CoA synthetase